MANEAATAGLALHSRACAQDEPPTRIASALLIAPEKVRGASTTGWYSVWPKQAGRQFFRATTITWPEFSLLLLEERQQLLETLIPVRVDLPGRYPSAQGFAVPLNGRRPIDEQASE